LTIFTIKKITKRCEGYEIQHLSKRYRERETGGGGWPFKLNIKDKKIRKIIYFILFTRDQAYSLNKILRLAIDKILSFYLETQKVLYI
jgi:hypothetical protein